MQYYIQTPQGHFAPVQMQPFLVPQQPQQQPQQQQQQSQPFVFFAPPAQSQQQQQPLATHYQFSVGPTGLAAGQPQQLLQHQQQQQQTHSAAPSDGGFERSSRACRHFQRGRCTWGDQCRFAHRLDPPEVPPSHPTSTPPQQLQQQPLLSSLGVAVKPVADNAPGGVTAAALQQAQLQLQRHAILRAALSGEFTITAAPGATSVSISMLQPPIREIAATLLAPDALRARLAALDRDPSVAEGGLHYLVGEPDVFWSLVHHFHAATAAAATMKSGGDEGDRVFAGVAGEKEEGVCAAAASRWAALLAAARKDGAVECMFHRSRAGCLVGAAGCPFPHRPVARRSSGGGPAQAGAATAAAESRAAAGSAGETKTTVVVAAATGGVRSAPSIAVSSSSPRAADAAIPPPSPSSAPLVTFIKAAAPHSGTAGGAATTTTATTAAHTPPSGSFSVIATHSGNGGDASGHSNGGCSFLLTGPTNASFAPAGAAGSSASPWTGDSSPGVTATSTPTLCPMVVPPPALAVGTGGAASMPSHQQVPAASVAPPSSLVQCVAFGNSMRGRQLHAAVEGVAEGVEGAAATPGTVDTWSHLLQ